MHEFVKIAFEFECEFEISQYGYLNLTMNLFIKNVSFFNCFYAIIAWIRVCEVSQYGNLNLTINVFIHSYYILIYILCVHCAFVSEIFQYDNPTSYLINVLIFIFFNCFYAKISRTWVCEITNMATRISN